MLLAPTYSYNYQLPLEYTLHADQLAAAIIYAFVFSKIIVLQRLLENDRALAAAIKTWIPVSHGRKLALNTWTSYATSWDGHGRAWRRLEAPLGTLGANVIDASYRSRDLSRYGLICVLSELYAFPVGRKHVCMGNGRTGIEPRGTVASLPW